MNGEPANVEAGDAKVAVGATFVTFTVAFAVAVSPPSSVTWTWTVRDDSPSSDAAEKAGLCPLVSKLPLSSRSQA